MKKLAKIILSLALALTVFASATNYQAADSATADVVNGYDWTATGGVEKIYLYATADETQTISTLTGQDAATYAWWWTVILEENSNGTYTVKSSDMATNNGAISKNLGEGTVIIMGHDSTKSQLDDFNWLKSLVAGDTIKLGKSFDDIAAQVWGSAYTVSIEKTAAPSADAGSNDAAADNAGSSNAGSTNSGSTNSGSTNSGSNVPATGDATPVVAMGSMLVVAFACVALGLKKRNA